MNIQYLKVVPSAGKLILLITFLLVACTNLKKKVNEEQLNNWYAQANKYRFIAVDSVVYYAGLLDSATVNAAPVYKAMACITKGFYQNKKSNFQLSLKEYTTALELLKQSKVDSLQAKAYAGIGSVNNNLGNFDVAVENLLKALRLFEKTNYSEGIGGIYSQLSQMYQAKNDIANAKTFAIRGLAATANRPFDNGYVLNLHSLANSYGMNNQIDSALIIDAQGLAIVTKMKMDASQTIFYDNKANCFFSLNKFDSADFYFRKCLLIDSSQGNFKQVSDTYLNLGGMMIQMGKYALAEGLLHHSIALADKTGYLIGKQYGWQALAQLYKQQKEFAKASDANDSVAITKDRVINEKSVAKIAELQEMYEAEKKEQIIQLQQARLSRQTIILAGIVSFFIALGFAGYFYVRREKIKKEKEAQALLYKQQQQATINILQAEEKERKRIATDLHDGVGQLMMAAWLNLQAVDEIKNSLEPQQNELLKKTILLVDESCKEVRSVSHNMMPNALLKKGLVNAVADFIQQIDNRFISINLQTGGLQTSLPSHVETILYRVIQEAVNNVIKHAAATKLDISINNDNDGTDVLIEDNGKGFNINAALKKEGIGLQNIKDRIEYLSGTVQWDSSENNGTVVSIFIPATK